MGKERGCKAKIWASMQGCKCCWASCNASKRKQGQVIGQAKDDDKAKRAKDKRKAGKAQGRRLADDDKGTKAACTGRALAQTSGAGGAGKARQAWLGWPGLAPKNLASKAR